VWLYFRFSLHSVTIGGRIMLRIARQVAREHPAVLTLVLLVFFAAQIVSSRGTMSPLLRGALMAFPSSIRKSGWS